MKNKLHRIYSISIVLLAVFSIILVFLDFGSVIDMAQQPWYIVDHIILVLFTIDYIVRFAMAKNKKEFFVKNIFDLIAIIPFSDILSLLRVARIFRIARLSQLTKLTKGLRLLRAFGFMGVVKKRAHKFLHTNGFIYILGTAGILIVCSSIAMSILEGKSFADALWWSIVTTTTVGYGDISPATPAGRIIAIVLMIFGISLISMLTGTITTYFTAKSEECADSKSVPENNDCAELLAIAQGLDKSKLEQLTAIAKVLGSS